jgi:uncharacterized integral membrane protein (TIGR00698 family)
VLVAVLVGIVIANGWTLPSTASAGLRFAVQRVLRLGIILIGARLDLVQVAAIGVRALGLVVVCMTVAFAFATLVGRRLQLPPRLAVLIGVGTAVCGNSAIIATAPVIKAEEREVTFAVATITLFGTLAVFAYPLIGRGLGLSDPVFGVWSGVAVNDTSQVVAASAAYSSAARDVATVVKLVRNALMAPLILLIAWWGSWSAAAGGRGGPPGRAEGVPLFVLGFLGMSVLRTIGTIDRATAGRIDAVATVFILIALAGVGLSTKLGQMRAVGRTPAWLRHGAPSRLSLFLIHTLGLGPALATAHP